MRACKSRMIFNLNWLFLFSCPIFSAVTSELVSKDTMPEIYRLPDDVNGISYALQEHGIVIVQGMYLQKELAKFNAQWPIFMNEFNKLVNSSKATSLTEYGTHFYDGLNVDTYLTYETDDFLSYKFGEGRYEIRFKTLPGNFVSEDVLTPEPMRSFLEYHFSPFIHVAPGSTYKSFYGLLPSMPGNKDGNLHRDTAILEENDVDARVSAQFSRAFYLTAIASIGDDPGSTEFYLGSHKMMAEEVKEKITQGQIRLIKPQMKEGDVKIFDGRIGHRGVANPIGGEERKGIYAVHHAGWYCE